MRKQPRLHVLSHTAVGTVTDEERLIGVFLTSEEGTLALERLRTQQGFRESVDGFVLEDHVSGDEGWREGFTWSDSVGDPRQLDASDVDLLSIDDNPDVFVLAHRRLYSMHESRYFIGVYLGAVEAREAAVRLSIQPGFRSFKTGFVVYGLALGTVHWADGFEVREAREQQLLTFSPPSLPADGAGD